MKISDLLLFDECVLKDLDQWLVRLPVYQCGGFRPDLTGMFALDCDNLVLDNYRDPTSFPVLLGKKVNDNKGTVDTVMTTGYRIRLNYLGGKVKWLATKSSTEDGDCGSLYFSGVNNTPRPRLLAIHVAGGSDGVACGSPVCLRHLQQLESMVVQCSPDNKFKGVLVP